ncbi:hypothetical protein [Streptomyces sp. NPDC054834]
MITPGWSGGPAKTPVPLVAVSRNGISCSGLQAAYGPEQLLTARRRA